MKYFVKYQNRKKQLALDFFLLSEAKLKILKRYQQRLATDFFSGFNGICDFAFSALMRLMVPFLLLPFFNHSYFNLAKKNISSSSH